MDVLDPESDSVRTCTYVEEAEELYDLVQKAVTSEGQDAGDVLARFSAIVSPPLTWKQACLVTAGQLISDACQCSLSNTRNRETCWIPTLSVLLSPCQVSFETLHSKQRLARTSALRL